MKIDRIALEKAARWMLENDGDKSPSEVKIHTTMREISDYLRIESAANRYHAIKRVSVTESPRNSGKIEG